MGQCVSQQPMMLPNPNKKAIQSSPQNVSTSDTSQEDALSETPEVEVDGGKVEDTLDYYGELKKNHFGGKMKELRKSSIGSLIPKVKGSRKSRTKSEKDHSAAFNMNFNKFNAVMLDINTATEEELMTLNGINRNIAHEIIEHRNAIGTFRKLEDLALVSGVGAAKFQAIKPEICIGKRGQTGSSASMLTANVSVNSLNGNAETVSIASSPKQERPKRRRRTPVSINTASIFQLMTVDGITQELAAHIVHYRDRKGPFKTLYDLRKVEGFTSRLVSFLGPNLTTETSPTPTTVSIPSSRQQPLQNGYLHNHRRTSSLPPGPLMDAGRSFIKPLTPVLPNSPVFPTISHFTKVLEAVNGSADENGADESSDSINGELVVPCENALRVLSWNLDGLSVDKARNPGVVSVIGKLFARYHINVAVIQGVTDPLGLTQLCESMNEQDEKQTYTCTTTDHGIGYLYQAHLRLNVNSSLVAAGCVPLNLATIENESVAFALVTCSLTQTTVENAPSALVHQLVKAVMDLSATERILFIVDFSHPDRALYVEEFQELGYRPTVAKDESTSYCQTKVSGIDGSRQIHCNILVSRYAQKALSGKWGVIRDGLTHILIPNGWSWNGPASLFCPVWVELKTDEEPTD